MSLSSPLTKPKRGLDAPGDSPWPPAAGGEPLVFLAEVSTPVERRIVDEWLAGHRPPDRADAAVELITFPHPRHDEVLGVDGIEARLRRGDDPRLVPLRVAWLPRAADSDPLARISDFLTLRDPRDPRPREQERIYRGDPSRMRVLVGEAARSSELRVRWERVNGSAGSPAEFARYVARQAVITLERAEAHSIDERYKLPRLVREEIVHSARYRDGVARLAAELDRDPAEVDAEALGYLDEMVSGRSRMLIDFTVRLGRFFVQQGYEEIDYVPSEIERVREVSRRHGIVVLPTHRSNLDALVMPVALYDHGLPRTHTLGGINMAFWPIGALSRRAGVIFIRRDTRSNPVYRWALREYVGYLIEKRFGLQWYPEGTRSRTGKLLPPKLGLLVYVADAYRQGRVDDVVIVPASIAYDQLQEVADFVDESVGGGKRSEGLGWAIDYWRKLRGNYGRIYVRFAEPVSMREALGPDYRELDGEDAQRALQKLAFEVMWRINQVTPITGTAMLTLVLLSVGGRSLTMELLRLALDDFLAEARRFGLPMAESARALETTQGVEHALHALVHNSVVTCYDKGPDAVYGIGADQHLAASFYRNSIIHFFLRGSIAELALVLASEVKPERALDTFWDEAFYLRDLLKLEFFFGDKEEFRALLAAELALRDTGWQSRVAEGRESILHMFDEVLRPLTAHLALRAIVEAYFVVAEALEDLGSAAEIDDRKFLAQCLSLGRQAILQGRIQHPESISKPLFKNGLEVARNLGLAEAGPDLAARRQAFAKELRELIARIDVVQVYSTERYVKLRTQTLGAP